MWAESNDMTGCNGRRWRASSDQKGKGKRDPSKDKACHELVPSEEAGYCECESGNYYYDAGHPSLRCRARCDDPRPYQLDETRDILSEYQELRLANREDEIGSVAVDQRMQRLVAVVLLAIGAYFLFFHGSGRPSAKEAYLERIKKDGVVL